MPVVDAPFARSADRRSVLDRAHVGDIEGALGTVASHDTGPRRSWRRRLGTLLAVMGPGLVVMAADNDAGGLSVYAQAGQEHGVRLMWVLVLLAPVLVVNQEMVARLGAVTGAGHARLIVERFGRLWGAFSLGDLLIVNLLTIVTEFVGVTLALGYFGVSRYVAVPLAAVALVMITSSGSFRRWERAMYALIALNALVVPLVLLARPHASGGLASGLVPHVPGGGDALLLLIALIGTTVAPWQLFLQQSSVVDKRISARWLAYERVDTLIGAAVVIVGAAALMFAASSLHGVLGPFRDAGEVARGLRSVAGGGAGALFALVLMNASIFGAAAVTLASSYALGDYAGLRHSLHRPWRDAPVFHGSFAACTLLGAGVVLIPGAPLGLITTAVQALAGVLLPSATVFLLLLCNDAGLLGPWTNPRWLNVAGTAVVGVLMVLSGTLTVTTVFPHADALTVASVLGAVGMVGFGMWGLALLSGPRTELPADARTPWERMTWTTPQRDGLTPPAATRGRTVGLVLLRAYVLTAGALLVVRAVEVAIA